MIAKANVYETSKRVDDGGKTLLATVTKLRYICAEAKVAATVEVAKHILEDQPAIVLFTFFQDVARSIHGQLVGAGWPGELLIGEVPQSKRQAMVDRFQVGTLLQMRQEPQ